MNTTSPAVGITVKTKIYASLDQVWEVFNDPKHIVNWYTASPDWHTPEASNNITEGGSFNYRMEEKDGDMGFHFEGSYESVEPHAEINAVLRDGRRIKTTFEPTTKSRILVVQSFEAETPFDLFSSEFTQNEQVISINGLIWMGDKRFMKEQILEKIRDPYALPISLGGRNASAVVKTKYQKLSNNHNLRTLHN